MAANPYAAPTAQVADVSSSETEAPALWNPNAAANWSLLFTPLFGSLLQIRNWQALDEPARAARAWRWYLASVFVLVSSFPLLMKSDAAFRYVGMGIWLVWILVWYFASAREQTRYVQEKFGKDYPRRGWRMPLLIAVGATVSYAVFYAVVIVALRAVWH